MLPIEKKCVIVSSASSATTTPDQINQQCKGIKIITNITVINTSVKVGLYGKDALGNLFTIIETEYTDTGAKVQNVYPATLATGPNVADVMNDILPSTFVIVATPKDSATFSVCYELIP